MPKKIRLIHFTGHGQRHHHESSTPVKGHCAGLCLTFKCANILPRNYLLSWGTVGACIIPCKLRYLHCRWLMLPWPCWGACCWALVKRANSTHQLSAPPVAVSRGCVVLWCSSSPPSKTGTYPPVPMETRWKWKPWGTHILPWGHSSNTQNWAFYSFFKTYLSYIRTPHSISARDLMETISDYYSVIWWLFFDALIAQLTYVRQGSVFSGEYQN